MKRSTIATIAVIVAYLAFSSFMLSAVVGTYGRDKDSPAMIATAIGLAVILFLLVTNKPLDNWIKGWDKSPKDDDKHTG
jgi:hypothetical protein